MRVIWKYSILYGSSGVPVEFLVPKGAVVLSLHTQRTMEQRRSFAEPVCPTIWMLVDPSAELEKRRFLIVATGEEFDDEVDASRFVGTFQIGSFVGHVFEVR